MKRLRRLYILLLAAAVLLAACSAPAGPSAGGSSLSAPPESSAEPAPASPSVPSSASGETPAGQEPPEGTEPVQPDPPVQAPAEDAPAIPDPLDQVPEDPAPASPPEQSTGEAPASSSESGSGRSAWTKGDDRAFWEIREDMVKNVAAFREANPDTVGWLYLGETTIDSPVFQTEDNTYYLKHNDYKAEDVNGAIVSDFRNRLTGRDSQSQNLVLYAHSKDENPDGGVEASREFEHFTELKRYQKKEFCEAHPYFLFATGEESMVFEVFAAFHTKTSFVYNLPDPSRGQMEAILEEAGKKSLFDFGVEVTAEDRIMTLSTCCRRIVPTYPNGYRFVVMGRLVEKGRPLQYEGRTVAENPSALTPRNIYE